MKKIFRYTNLETPTVIFHVSKDIFKNKKVYLGELEEELKLTNFLVSIGKSLKSERYEMNVFY